MLLDQLGQFRLRVRLLPLVARLERDEHVGQFDAHRIGGDFGGADAAPDVFDFVGKVARIAFSICVLYSIESSRSVPVSRTTLMAMAPSDSRGTNSDPKFGAIRPKATNIRLAATRNDQRFVSHRHAQDGNVEAI